MTLRELVLWCKNVAKEKWDHTAQILYTIAAQTQTMRALKGQKPDDIKLQDFHPFILETEAKTSTPIKSFKSYILKGELPPLPPLE